MMSLIWAAVLQVIDWRRRVNRTPSTRTRISLATLVASLIQTKIQAITQVEANLALVSKIIMMKTSSEENKFKFITNFKFGVNI